MVEMKGLEEERPVQPMEGKDGYLPPANNNNNASSGSRNIPRSKNDIIDSLCTSINQDLLIAKTFYFFFFSAFGSLFPLMAVYFKQMGMNPTQSGLLIGVRPFVEFLAAPFWGSMADRFRQGKVMLLFSLASWIVFTLALAFIQPPASSCMLYNETESYIDRVKEKRSVPENYRIHPDEQKREFKFLRSLKTIIEEEEGSTPFKIEDMGEEHEAKLTKSREHNNEKTHETSDNGKEDKAQEITREKTHGTSLDDLADKNEENDSRKTEPHERTEEKTHDTSSDHLTDESKDEARKMKPQESTKEKTHDTSSNDLTDESKEDKARKTKPQESTEEKTHDRSSDGLTDDESKEDETRKTKSQESTEEKTHDTSSNKVAEKSEKDETEKTKPQVHAEEKTRDTSSENSENDEPVVMDGRSRRKHQKEMPTSTLEESANYDESKHGSYISPIFSSIVYKAEDVQEVFFLLMLLIILGEFFSAPAITLADSATLCYLADNTDNYGKQRMFGSLGWGLAMFFVGIALDYSTTFPYHPCSPHERERNYTICFATFSVLMGCAFISATQFKFDYDAIDDQIAMKPVVIENGPKGTSLPSFLTEGTVIDDTPIPPPPRKEPPATKSTVFAQTTRELPEWLAVMRTFANLRYGAFLYVTWFMGFGIGLVFTFLFWHLQDLGGTPTLFGVASVINHISEIFAYFFSFKFIKKIGHTKVLCIGLAGNVGRFLYISYLTDPWWVLPFEFVQGITHASVWAACCSYITQATPTNMRSSAQGVLQGLHHGLGRGCGAVIGGIFVNYFGTRVTFRGYGFACLIVLILFVFINYYKRDKGFSSFQDDQEPETFMEETFHLAPHGVPSNPMARSLSKQNMGTSGTNNNNESGGGGGYGTADPATSTAGGFLGVPGSEGGNYGGVGGTNYTADFNMNPTTPTPNGNGALTRRALAAAFNPKGILAQAASPEATFEYHFIRRDFQAYDEVTILAANENDNGMPKGHILVGPTPKTKNFTPQPPNRSDNSYDW